MASSSAIRSSTAASWRASSRPRSAAGECRLAEIRQRRPSPECERFAKRLCRGRGNLDSRLFSELLEALQVELALFDAKEVARAAGGDPVGAEQLAERVYRHLERVGGLLRRMLAPESVDEALAKDDLVRVEEEIASSAR